MRAEHLTQSYSVLHLDSESPIVLLGQVFNLSSEGGHRCKDSDAGADVFFPSNQQYYMVIRIIKVFQNLQACTCSKNS